METTLDGLLKAFVGESQARNRYTFYASKARKEGYEQIGEIFSITSDNEREHASWYYKMILEVANKNKIDVYSLKTETDVPYTLGTTEDNLKAAIAGETHEYSSMYPQIADMAMKDGFKEIAVRIRAIAKAEKHHAERYEKLLGCIKNKTTFVKEEPIFWMCRECGFVHFGKKAPETCPSCGHAQAFYQILSENY